MKALKMLIALNLIAFLVASQSDKAIAFDTELFGCPTAETLKKGEWDAGMGLWYGIVPLRGYIKLGIISRVEALAFIEFGNLYYGLKINCLEEKELLPTVAVAFHHGFAIVPIAGIGAGHGDVYGINCFYLILSQDIGNLKLNTGIGNGKNPPLLTANGDGRYNANGYFTYGSIEKSFGKTNIFLGINRYNKGSNWVIGGSYKIKKFLLKLAGGFWSEKFFELPKNENYYLMPVLTIEYNRRKGE